MKRRCSFKADLIAVAVLVVAAYKLTFALASIMDIDVRDETVYLYNGLRFLSSGFPHPDYSPLYAVWYCALSHLQSDPLRLYYVNLQVLTILLPVLLYVLLRRLGLSPLAAMLVSAYFIISHALLPSGPKPCHFMMLVLLVFLILSTFAGSFLMSTLCVAIGTLVSAFVRPEMFFSFALLMVLYVVLFSRNFRQILRSRGQLATLLLLTVAVLLSSALIIPACVEHKRSFIAFGQHFAFNWVRWDRSTLDPWENFRAIVHDQFGPVRSIYGAFSSNPLLFMKHVGYNIINTPVTMAKLLIIHYNIVFPLCSRAWWVVEGALLLAAFAGYVSLILARSPARVIKACRARSEMLVHYALLCVPGLVASFIVFPRRHYLLVPSVLLLGTLAVCIVGDAGKRVRLATLGLVGAAVIALTPCLSQHNCGGTLVLTGKMVNVETIRVMKSMGITEPVNLLDAEGRLHVYAGDNFYLIRAIDKDCGFHEFVENRRINLILVTEGLRNNLSFVNDTEWKHFLHNPEAFGFERMDVPGTGRFLLVRQDLLHGT